MENKNLENSHVGGFASVEEKKHLSTQTHYEEPREQGIKTNNWPVHASRILVKSGIVWALYSFLPQGALPLSILIISSEVLELLGIYAARHYPNYKTHLGVAVSIYGIILISLLTWIAGWSINDFYLIYLLQISSTVIIYGSRVGAVSTLLSVLAYGLILYLEAAPALLYLRLLLVFVISFRLLINQDRWEKTFKTLKDLLGTEKSKQDFIALASHNLRTPVAAIYGYIDILTRSDAGQMNPEQLGFVEKIKSNNHQLEKLTEELLQISILEVGKEVNLLREASQIEIIVDNIIERLESSAKAKGLNLEFKRPAGLLPLVKVDVEKIQSVLSNLIDNGIKYTQKGGVIIEAKQDGDNIIIKVTDTGVGIPESELSKVFNKFYRSGNLLVYNQTGVGLGLYLGHKIVELHGGKMSVESVEGQGTTFTVSLPILREEVLE